MNMTIDQLKKLKTYELADMLTNVVLLLKSMPDIECGQLLESVPDDVPVELIVVEPPPVAPLFTREELKKKTVAELKMLAKSLNVFFSSAVKKDELIHKILTRPSDGKSEQRAIRDL
jgi:Rho termination factor, N-terminal domain